MGEGDGSLPRRAPRPARALRAGTGPAADRRDHRPQPRLPDDRHQPAPPGVGRLPDRRRARLRRGAPRPARPVVQLGGLDAAARRALRARRRVLHRARRVRLEPGRPALLRAGDERARGAGRLAPRGRAVRAAALGRGRDARHPRRRRAARRPPARPTSSSTSSAPPPRTPRSRSSSPSRPRPPTAPARRRRAHAARLDASQRARHASTRCSPRSASASRTRSASRRSASSCSPRTTLLVPARGRRLGDDERSALGALPYEDYAALLDPAYEADGVVLLSPEEAERLLPRQASAPSTRAAATAAARARGTTTGCSCRCATARAALAGMIWADEPDDRLLPGREQRQALRAFANQAMSAVASAAPARADAPPRRARPAHRPAQPPRAAGAHRRRDPAPARAGRRAGLRPRQLQARQRPARLRAGRRGAAAHRRRAAQRRRAAASPRARRRGVRAGAARHRRGRRDGLRRAPARRDPARLDDFPRPLTAVDRRGRQRPGRRRPPALLRAATRACVGAKRLGRNRCVAYHAEALDALLGSLETGEAASEQLAAAMLLAETLDVRDVGTARHSQTVGHYAEAIARALGLPEGRVERIRAAGVLHDIGKLGVADAVLKKPGRSRRRVGRDAPPRRARLADPLAREPARHQRLGARAPRARRRRRIPAGPGRRGDPDRGAHPRRRRRLRGDDRRPRRTGRR